MLAERAINWPDSRIEVTTAVFRARYPSSLLSVCGAMAAIKWGRFSAFFEEYPYAVAMRQVCRERSVIDEVTSVKINEGITSCAPGMPSANVVALPSSAPSTPNNRSEEHTSELQSLR